MFTGKLSTSDIRGNLVKQDARYHVRDNEILESLTLSSTVLNPDCSTTGHTHAGTEEYYFFVSGAGIMEVDSEKILVKEGDIVPVVDGAFHRVNNESKSDTLSFVCVLGGKRTELRARNA